MPRTARSLAALFAFALLLGACGSEGERDSNDLPQIQFDSARATSYVEHLANTIGPRVSGTDGAHDAADYIADEFAKARFGVFRLQFTYEADPNRAASIGVGSVSVPAVTAGGSAEGSATGPAAELGPGAAGSLAGKIAVAQRGGGSFFEKYESARAAGAAALVIVNNEPGLLTANLGAKAAIPVVTVAQSDAASLLSAAQAGGEVTVDVVAARIVDGVNVVARAQSAHACVYVMTANYDSQPGSSGADENASGVAVMLELAQQFAVMDELPAVCFVATDAGFARGAGATAYIQGVAEGSRPAVVINVHGVGGQGAVIAGGDSFLEQDAEALAERLGLRFEAGRTDAITAGTEGFRALSIPVLELSRDASARGATDSLEGFRAGSLSEAGRLAGALLVQLSVRVEP